MKPVITAPYIGKRGRFGNQLFQYMFAKAYAEHKGADLLVPEGWIGRRIFDITDGATVGHSGPVLMELPADYYLEPRHLALYTREFCKHSLRVQDYWLQRFPKPKPFYVAAHIRQGDRAAKGLDNIYPIVSRESVEQAIVSRGYDLTDVVWVEENKATAPHDSDLHGIEFLPDFLTLLQADVLFRGASSFSFWAGVLSNAQIYSPVITKAGAQDCQYAPGNHHRISLLDNEWHIREETSNHIAAIAGAIA